MCVSTIIMVVLMKRVWCYAETQKKFSGISGAPKRQRTGSQKVRKRGLRSKKKINLICFRFLIFNSLSGPCRPQMGRNTEDGSTIFFLIFWIRNRIWSQKFRKVREDKRMCSSTESLNKISIDFRYLSLVLIMKIMKYKFF